MDDDTRDSGDGQPRDDGDTAHPGARHPGAEAAEQAAAMLAAAGMPRMPARVMMALVGSPDEGYTAAEIGERLGVSPAAVSGAVRYLQTLRLVQRLSRPGDRRDRYDLADDAWGGVITSNAPMYARLGELMEQIADDNGDAPTSATRARTSADFLRFLADRMPQLVVEWEQTRYDPSPGSDPS
ncbi:GbsR/MarR family transcriptional regulator [Microbacterium hominis]|uniref:MarR family transcriptional regulator n=1 Tax=Microbacterium hominis TaxID=162426 RepID=A0A7D4U9G8_9MICO|nr:helix-turn-helix domain-containing protein [Microbacterium hominis]QKJ20726.1 MarR family transcriptional regulator [Microbacterium hominis]